MFVCRSIDIKLFKNYQMVQGKLQVHGANQSPTFSK